MGNERYSPLVVLMELLPIFIVIVSYGSIAMAILNANWFRWQYNALSDLGADPRSSIFFNTGLIISGILLMLYVSYVARDHLEYSALHGIIFLFFSGVFLTSIGLFPEPVEELHYAVSVFFFFTFPIGQLLFSIHLKLRRGSNAFILLGLLSFFGSLAIWSYSWRSIGVTGVAIPELLSTILGILWLIYFTYSRLSEKRIFFRHE